MPKITELPVILGSTSAYDDLFLTVDVSAGAEGTKRITRAELVEALCKDIFYGLEVRNGVFINPDIILSNEKTALADADYIPITDHLTNTTFKFPLSSLFDRIAELEIVPSEVVVDIEHGNDVTGNGSGRTPFATIGRALTAVAANENLKSILVGGGAYTIPNTLTIPKDVRVYSKAGPYATTLNSGADFMFALHSGSVLEGFSVAGQTHNTTIAPTTGFVARFADNAIIQKPPVIRNVIQTSAGNHDISFPNPSNGNPDAAKGAGIFYANPSDLDFRSLFAVAILDSCEMQSPNGVGVMVDGPATVMVYNTNSRYAHSGYMANAGGSVLVQTSSSSFGDYSGVATGTKRVLATGATPSLVARPAKSILIRDSIEAVISAINAFVSMNAMPNQDLLNGISSGLLLSSLSDFYSGTIRQTTLYSMSMYLDSVFRYDAAIKANLLTISQSMSTIINSVVALTEAETNTYNSIMAKFREFIETPEFVQIPSVVNLVGHSFNYVGTGTSMRNNTYSVGRGKPANATVKAINGGVVKYSGQDQMQNFYFSNANYIEGGTGKLVGSAFKKQPKIIGRRYSNSRSAQW